MELKQKLPEVIVARQLQLLIIAVSIITDIYNTNNLVPIDFLIF